MLHRQSEYQRRYHLVLGLIASGVVAVTCVQHFTKDDSPTQDDAAQRVQKAVLPSAAFAATSSTEGAPTIADIAEASVPSVVNIWATKTVSTQRSDAFPFSRDPFFRDFFGPDFFDRIPRERKTRSLGSGVVVTKGGVILTNSHVVENADDLRITLSDGRDVEAEVVGADAKSDLAVLRLKGDPGELTPLPIGDSSSLRLGDIVIAIGNPFGVGQTVTMGIVSALGRGNLGIVDYEDFVQTDAAINPGNSGGALVNMRGELIGLNTAIVSRSGGYQGVGFAIPSNLARPTMEILLNKGEIIRGWLGVVIQDLDENLAEALGTKPTTGVVVSDVTPKSPAAKAGVKRGDIITEINGVRILSTSKLRNTVALSGPKAKVNLTVLRDGTPRVFAVVLGELPAESATAVEASPTASESAPLGLSLTQLDDNTREAYNISKRVVGGVVVTDVDASSRAARAGMRVGDVILELNRKPVRSIEDFKTRVSKSKGALLILLQRQEATVFVALTQ